MSARRQANLILNARAGLLAFLACMLLLAGFAPTRATVRVFQAETGAAVIYETEVHGTSPAAFDLAQTRLGRKPFENRDEADFHLFGCPQAPPASVRLSPASRAPPHSPRAPPVAA